MKTRFATLTLACLALLVAIGSAAYNAIATGEKMTVVAAKFLEALSPELRAKASMDYDAPQRVDWHFIPKAERKGVQIREMNKEQRTLAMYLLRSALSEAGYGKATKIIELEALLKDLEKEKKGTPLRDTERYYFTVFGKPTAEGKWGLSIEGHHMSHNFVVENGRVISSTPSMFGANPATVKSSTVPGIEPGLRVLAKEEQLAFDLLGSLDAEQRKIAVIAEKAFDEVRTAGAPLPPNEAPVGLSGGKLNDNQKKLLWSLIEVYAANVPEDVASQRLEPIRSAGVDKLYFAWAGADKPGVGHYYRIQGESFVIEFVNTQPDAAGNPANHIHCTWRDLHGDFAIPIKK